MCVCVSGHLLGGLLEGPGGLAQGAVHVLGADLQRVWVCALDQVFLVHQERKKKMYSSRTRWGDGAAGGERVCHKRSLFLSPLRSPSACRGLVNKQPIHLVGIHDAVLTQ